jgi:hypothetical protein
MGNYRFEIEIVAIQGLLTSFWDELHELLIKIRVIRAKIR